jgi:methyltransferase-like protein/cyclopropane fatty-acyl-phospholipid synthase-like methyltransferase
VDTAVTPDDRVRDAYERVPYPSGSQPLTHPDHLATMAILAGIDPAPPDRCRVLEIGCANGGNLIPMAFELRESAFVGFDLSPRQIESGRAFARDLGLANVELRVESIADARPGTFDYIVCHGVFSWVRRDVQEAILALCRQSLAPNGIAYISYNTYPGWYGRGMLREIVQWHTRAISDDEEKAQRAVELVRFLADAAASGDPAHAAILQSAREQFDEFAGRPSYIVHEYFEETNEPFWFHDFVVRAAAQRLQYIADAEPGGGEVDLDALTHDRIEREQYFDFVVNRRFRRSLLCRDEVVLDRAVTPERMRRLHVSTATQQTEDGRFRTERGKPFSATHPLALAALVELTSIAPRAMSFDDVRAALQTDELALTDLLAALHASGVIDLHVLPPNCTNVVGAYPKATELARRQAAAGELVTSQRRRVLKLDDPIARFLLQRLDGTRDHAALARLLDREVSAGRLDISVDGCIPDPHRIPAVLQAVVEHHLRKMAGYALLVER